MKLPSVVWRFAKNGFERRSYRHICLGAENTSVSASDGSTFAKRTKKLMAGDLLSARWNLWRVGARPDPNHLAAPPCEHIFSIAAPLWPRLCVAASRTRLNTVRRLQIEERLAP